MTDPMKLTADQILAINIASPERLFSLAGFTMEIKRLRGKWHPDLSSDPKANDVFVHLMKLASVARTRIATNSWALKAQVTFTDNSTQKSYNFKYKKMHTFELGKMYIGDTHVLYLLEDSYNDLYENGLTYIRSIRYPDSKMKKEFERFLPNVTFSAKTNIGNVVLISKPKDAILLQDLIDAIPGNKIDPIHVAWIVGSMYNIATFLDFIKISHNSILPSTVFIDTKKHGVFLLGGWWYATKSGNDIKALPSQIVKMLPAKILTTKKAKSIYDRQAVKGLGVFCLGDPTFVGSKLLADKTIPLQLVRVLRTPSGDDAIKEFSGWYQMLKSVFGKREFTKFNFDTSNIYE